MPPRALLLLVLLAGLAACQDTRRDAVREWLKAHPPEHFTVVEIPEKITISGANESVVTVKYRLEQPTVEEFDALKEPRASASLRRINAVRGWALSTLPADEPLREKIASASAAARDPQPVKRIVTPAGTVVETLAVLKISKAGDQWQITPESLDAHVPGAFDSGRDIPLASAPEATARLDRLESLAAELEAMRWKYLEDRRIAAARSLAALKSRLQTGSTFDGELRDGAAVRLVVTHGFDAGEPVAVVLTVQRGMLSSARYTGAVAQLPSGESTWRAAQVQSLSGRGGDLVTDADYHPILTLVPTSNGLNAQIKAGGLPARSIDLHPSGKADLIPDPQS